MQAGDCLDDGAARGVEVAEVDEVVGQGPALVASPGGEGRKQCPLVDQADLQGEQTKEEVALGINGGHGTGLPNAGVAAGAWTPTTVSSPRAMSWIGTIIAWPLV